MQEILTTQSQRSARVDASEPVPNNIANEGLMKQLEREDLIRQKLNEHIVYLQNEIRKRDELLETSDFEDGFESSLDEDVDDDID